MPQQLLSELEVSRCSVNDASGRVPEKVKPVRVRNPGNAGTLERGMKHLFPKPVRIRRLTVDPAEAKSSFDVQRDSCFEDLTVKEDKAAEVKGGPSRGDGGDIVAFDMINSSSAFLQDNSAPDDSFRRPLAP